MAGPSGGEIAGRWTRFADALGLHDASFLEPAASETDLAATEADLGYALPADLRELLSVHNGGHLLDGHLWLGCGPGTRGGLAASSQWFHGFVTDQLAVEGQLDVVPGPRTLYLAAESQVGILYDLDDLPGRLLYLDVLRNPAVIPLCRDLATLLECFVELAEAGHVIVGGHAPILGDPADGRIGAILRRHGVAERPFGTAAP